MVESIQANISDFSLAINKTDNKSNNLDSNFSQLLKENINKVDNLQKEANQLTTDFALGKTDNIHQVTIASEKARVALDLTTSIQNKVMDAYEEIMRIQV